jgi:hypothetical protein
MDEDKLWIEEQKKLLNIKTNYKREPLEYINLHFCYVDANNSIVNLKTEKHIFRETQTITETQLFNIIEKKKHDANINYIFSELSLFIVDVEPENIQSIEPIGTPFFKSLPFISNIVIPQSIFIFHPLNSLFFLFKQHTKGNKSTKKVTFVIPQKKHTRRNI